MSRHTIKTPNKLIAYGFDSMLPTGGYFFQVFDENAISDENDEGIVVNEGFLDGISKDKMLSLMNEYGIQNKTHLEQVAMDLPI